MIQRIIIFGLLVALTACGAEKPPYPGLKIGKTYQINGRSYTPAYQPHYDKTGYASWYGPGFHGGMSASGERYDQYAMTAAHKTLPLPSIVRVTNLDNGRSAIIKVNDRGPFVDDRIIDLSRAGAEKLDIYRKGTAKVRVQFLDQETKEYVMSHYKGTASDPYLASNVGMQPPQETSPARVRVAAAPAPAPVSPKGSVFALVDEANAEPEDNWQPPKVYVSASTGERGGYLVQVGTFSVRQNAERLKQDLSSLGNVAIRETSGSKGSLYRLMLGPYTSQTEAKNSLSKLASRGISGARIIQN